MPYHILFDRLEEERLGKNSFGSTKSGIAPFYSDKYLKIGLQVCEIFDDRTLLDRLTALCEVKNASLDAIYHSSERLDPKALYNSLCSYRERLQPLVGDTAVFLHQAVCAGKDILLEGQLGALKDPDNGIYPFTTSSSPLAGFASVGAAGIPPHAIQQIITVVKAYSSAVGAGAFVSELSGDQARELRDRGGDGGEYGATTGRPRRVGWLDTVAVRRAVQLNSLSGFCLTKLDVLDGLKEVKLCVAYRMPDGREVTTTPLAADDWKGVEPIYETMPGWSESTFGVKDRSGLPQAALNYIKRIEELTGVPIDIISTGPDRTETMILRDPFDA